MDEHTEIERALRQALRHKAPPEGFTERVMARVATRGSAMHGVPTERRGQGTLLQTFPPAAWWTAAAAALLLTLGGGTALHSRQQELHRVDAAEAQVDEALQLTQHALDQVTTNVNRSQAGQVAQVLLKESH